MTSVSTNLGHYYDSKKGTNEKRQNYNQTSVNALTSVLQHFLESLIILRIK
ncbi:MAG: hypothetical protein ACRCUY_07990 [Thermoguttaceae bacterium]